MPAVSKWFILESNAWGQPGGRALRRASGMRTAQQHPEERALPRISSLFASSSRKAKSEVVHTKMRTRCHLLLLSLGGYKELFAKSFEFCKKACAAERARRLCALSENTRPPLCVLHLGDGTRAAEQRRREASAIGRRPRAVSRCGVARHHQPPHEYRRRAPPQPISSSQPSQPANHNPSCP